MDQPAKCSCGAELQPTVERWPLEARPRCRHCAAALPLLLGNRPQEP